MFIDAREVEFGTVLKSEVCIVGGGLAGLTLAQALSRKGIAVCLVESGGFRPDPETSSLGRMDQVGLGDRAMKYSPWRAFGGRMEAGDGICRPLDDHDFTVREWIAHSGWPFGKATLEGYYEEARTVLRIGSAGFDTKACVAELGRRDVRRTWLPTDKVVDRVVQFSPLRAVVRAWRREIDASDLLTTVLYATAIDLETDASAQTVRRLTAVTLRGRKIFVIARHYVLATGAIENARLLLASNRVHTAGLGNGHDLVGRFFMDQPRIRHGAVRLSDAWKHNKLYDDRCRGRGMAVAGTRFAAQYALSPSLQEHARLLNGLVWLSSHFGGQEAEIREAFGQWNRLATSGRPVRAMRPLVAALLAHPAEVLRIAVGSCLNPHWLRRGVQFHAVVEPAPDPDSRLVLTDDLDPLGMRRVRVNWRLGHQVQRTVDQTLSILAEELRRAGVADVALSPGREDGERALQTRRLDASGYYMGTTRMHDSPKRGVVDRHGRVHGMHNLFIAGASVFPTAGAAPPTMTVVALALRLADQLSQLLKEPHVHLHSVP